VETLKDFDVSVLEITGGKSMLLRPSNVGGDA
jgi:hypothetical protein